MRNRILWLSGTILLAAGGITAWSLGWGQEQPAAGPSPTSITLKTDVAPGGAGGVTKLSPLQQQFFLAAKAGKEWLLRINRADGRFLSGLEPSLRIPLKEDNYLHQAAAAFALARSAGFFKENGAAAVARQALLTLLLETAKDPQDPKVRLPVATGCNRLAAAAWLVLAINELPNPDTDLRQQGEELCHFIQAQQQKDGSLGPAAAGVPATSKIGQDRSEWHVPGLALYALTRSLRHAQEPWKLEVVRKARDFYQAQWRANKNTEMVPWHTAACADAYLMTREQAFAQCVNEMNDWLCTLQYREVQPQRLHWNGGFKKWEQGEVLAELPDVHAAVFMEGLAQGWRVAKQAGDLQRDETYRLALEQCAHFLLGLQYTEANAQHFEAKYRQDFLLGGFHATHQSGLLRLDFTQEAVCGLVKYLADVAEVK
jgi:hypothetical protein